MGEFFAAQFVIKYISGEKYEIILYFLIERDYTKLTNKFQENKMYTNKKIFFIPNNNGTM
jgi:hypothetical protein